MDWTELMKQNKFNPVPTTCPVCKLEFTPRTPGQKACSTQCGASNRKIKATHCLKCKDPLDRNGILCVKCFKAKRKEDHKKSNRKRKSNASSIASKFIQRTGLPLHKSIVSLAYGWS